MNKFTSKYAGCNVPGCCLGHYRDGYCQYHYTKFDCETEKANIKNEKKPCKDCIYYLPLAHNRKHVRCCQYILETGEPRGCDPVGCLRYTKVAESNE